MAETEMYTGVVTALLNKYADPILKGVTGFAKDGWEKFKVDFDIVFRKYLKNSVEKYGRIKTILYRTEPKNIYDFYFEKLSPAICFDYVNDDDKTHLMLCVKFSGSAVDFLYTMAGYYIKRDSRERIARVQQAVNKLETYLLSERDYSIGEQFEAASCRGDPKAYSLVKDTWIGETLCTMSRLGRILEERKREEAIDLSSLLT